MLKNKAFWAGVVVGYAVIVLFPQLNVRTKLRG
jgi:hypothetical protein